MNKVTVKKKKISKTNKSNYKDSPYYQEEMREFVAQASANKMRIVNEFLEACANYLEKKEEHTGPLRILKWFKDRGVPKGTLCMWLNQDEEFSRIYKEAKSHLSEASMVGMQMGWVDRQSALHVLPYYDPDWNINHGPNKIAEFHAQLKKNEDKNESGNITVIVEGYGDKLEE